MRVWQRVLAFVAVLAAVFAAAVGIGRLAGPIAADEGDHGHDGHSGTGYTLRLADDRLAAGRAEVAFTIDDDQGEPLTSYDVQHERELHLIAVRTDLAEFRHVHPRLDRRSGVWSVPVDLVAGSWRFYADFVPAGGEQTVVADDLRVSGEVAPQDLGADRAVSRVDGYEVHLERDGSLLTLHVTRDGEDVTDLEPYLGAYGHLVALRADDLAYLHVHPEDGPPGPEIAFRSDLADAGRYRLFLDFKHAGTVHTADFTVTVEGAPEESEEVTGGHDH